MLGENPLPQSVLVVDDEPSVLDVLTRTLKKAGYPVTCVASGEAAFEALAKESFGALLTDKNLPGKNGLEVIKEARRLHPYCACLLMTGYANTESVVEAMRLGANDYLEKPFAELGLVIQRLKAAFEHQRVMFESAALVEGLRYMQQTLKSREKEVFAHRTELQLLQHVVEVRVEDATIELSLQVGSLEADRNELQDRLSKLLRRDAELADGLRTAAVRCAATAKKSDLSVEKARELLVDLEQKLIGDAATLKG